MPPLLMPLLLPQLLLPPDVGSSIITSLDGYTERLQRDTVQARNGQI